MIFLIMAPLNTCTTSKTSEVSSHQTCAQLFIFSSAVDKRVLPQIFHETLETEGGEYIKLAVIDEYPKADLCETAKKKE